jgi:oligosaccharide repeat unit polymerase
MPNSSNSLRTSAELGAAAVIALAAGVWIAGAENPWASGLIAVIAALCLAQTLGIILKDGDIFAPPALFIAFTAIFYIIRPLAILDASPTVVQSFSQADMCAALAIVILSMVCFYAGYWLPTNKPLARRLPVGSPYWSRQRTYALGAAILALSCLAWWLFLRHVGGWLYWMLNLHYGVHHLRAGIGHLYVLASFGGLAFIVLYAYALRWQGSRVAPWAVALVSLPILLSLGERGMLIVWVLMALALYHYLGRRLSWQRAALYLIPVVVIFLAVGIWREQTTGATGSLQARQSAAFQGSLTSFDMLLYIVHSTPAELDYQWGRFIPAFITTPVPRAIFPDKLDTIALYVNDHLFGRRRGTTIALSLPGEGFVNAGLLGVALWALLLGGLSRTAYEYLQLHRRNVSAVVLYALWIALLIGFFRGGITDFPAAMALVRIGFMVGVVWLLGCGATAGTVARRSTERQRGKAS